MAATQLNISRVNRARMSAFLRQHAWALIIWPLSCLLLIALLWGLTLAKLTHVREAAIESAVKRASSLSRIYARQVAYSLEHINLASLHAKYDWELSRGTLDLANQAQSRLYPTSGQLYISIYNREGVFVASTGEANRQLLSLAGAAYFDLHKKVPDSRMLITGAADPSGGRNSVLFTRRLDAEDGSFDGVAMVSVEPGYLASFVEESKLDENTDHFLLSGNGELLATKRGDERPLAAEFHSTPVFSKPEGVTHMAGDSFIHGHPSIVAWQKLQNFPVVASVVMPGQDVLSAYEVTGQEYRSMATAASLFLLVLGLTGMAVSARLIWRRRQSEEAKRQAEEVKKAYRLATDGAREGFFILRPLYDMQGRIVDFLIEDCNDRGAAYYATTRTALIGATIASFWPNAYATEVIGLFVRVMELGIYEDEFKVPPDSPLKISWVQRRFLRSGNGLAITLRDISEMKSHQEELARLANADTVTTLHNRHWLMNYLPIAVERARDSQAKLALLFVDLDDFKNINDTLGHAAGDELLRAAALRLKSVVRPQDNVVRLGGDEFTVLLEQVQNGEDVSAIADRIVSALQEPFELAEGARHVVHASVGISLFPDDGEDGESILKHADIAMYAAKANGKGQYRFYERRLSESLISRVNMEQALRLAIERDEFTLYYQPRVGATCGELRGMEALVRWNHPERGLVPPNEFIPVAEQTGLIVQLGELVVKKAIHQLAQWKRDHLPLVPVSVNVSPRQFNQGSLSELLANCMTGHGVDASLIEVEITESCVIGESPSVTEELRAIEALGVKLLIDDFGTGYSSLSQLQRLDVDVLKVDRAFTAQLGSGKEGEALFMAILSMAHVLGLSVVAEGVETIEQLRLLQTLACNEIQGYLISKPVPPSEVPALLRKRFLFPEQFVLMNAPTEA